jgi:hypothetical protein
MNPLDPSLCNVAIHHICTWWQRGPCVPVNGQSWRGMCRTTVAERRCSSCARVVVRMLIMGRTSCKRGGAGQLLQPAPIIAVRAGVAPETAAVQAHRVVAARCSCDAAHGLHPRSHSFFALLRDLRLLITPDQQHPKA